TLDERPAERGGGRRVVVLEHVPGAAAEGGGPVLDLRPPAFRVAFEDGRLLDVPGPLGIPPVVDGPLVAALGRRVDADPVTHLLGHSTSSLPCLAWRRRACAGAGTHRGALPTGRAARGAA